MTRWNSVLHSKDLPFHWGALIYDPPALRRAAPVNLVINLLLTRLFVKRFFYFVYCGNSHARDAFVTIKRSAINIRR